jgi:hypothetical protein
MSAFPTYFHLYFSCSCINPLSSPNDKETLAQQSMLIIWVYDRFIYYSIGFIYDMKYFIFLSSSELAKSMSILQEVVIRGRNYKKIKRKKKKGK